MSELSFEQMLDESFKTIRNGEIVEGTIIGVKPDEIILNIGYKSDGILTKSEYSNTPPEDLTMEVSVGDKMEVKVLKVNDGDGQVALTYKRLAADKGNERLKEAFENKEVLKAKVTQILGGGLCATVDEARVFIPASLVSDSYEKDLKKYADQEIEFVISEFNPRRNRVIGDRRQLLVAERAEKQKELFAKLQVGDVVEGTVKNVTDFGAFVDLGGVDGLLHISEMSWGRVENPKKVFHAGEVLKVLVKDIKDTKVALSLKFPETNPWANAGEKFAVGTIVTGRVARMTDFGAFVELAPGVDALLHVSQISKNHVEKPSDYLSVNEEITAKVVDLNEVGKKISLSMKVLEKDPDPKEIAEEVEELLEEAAAEGLLDNVEEVAEAVEEAAEEVAEAVEEAVEEAAEEVADAVEEEAEEVAEALEEKVEEAVEVAEEKVEEAAEAVEEKVEEVAEALEEVIDKVAGGKVEVAQAIEEAIEEIPDAQNEKVEEVAEAVEEKVEDAVESLEETIKDVAELEEEKIEEVAEVVEEKVEEAAEAVEEKLEEVADAAE